MKRRSVLASMGAFTASGSLIMGSEAFTSAEVERDVNIDVVGDPYAFLGLVYPSAGCRSKDELDDENFSKEESDDSGLDDCKSEPQSVSVEEGGEKPLFFALNRFNVEIGTFEVEIDSDHKKFDSITIKENKPPEFDTGDVAKVTVESTGAGGTTFDEVPVKIKAEGSGTTVEATRVFEVTVEEQAEPKCGVFEITSDTNGNLKINVERNGSGIEVISDKIDGESFQSTTCLDIIIKDGVTLNGGLKVGVDDEISVNLIEEEGSDVNGSRDIRKGLLNSLLN